MARRVHIGRRPDGAETGFWITRPGYDALTDDRFDRNKFRFSSSFSGRRPLRVVASGYSQTTAAIWCPDIGAMEPIFSYRLMLNGTSERPSVYTGSGQDGSGGSYSASETYSRCIYPAGGGRYFVVYGTLNPGAVVGLRYMITVF